LFEEAGLLEGPAGEGWASGEGFFLEADLGVAVLELLDDFFGKGAAAGDLAEVLGHLAEAVGGAVGEEEDGGVGRVVGSVHQSIYGITPSPPVDPDRIFESPRCVATQRAAAPQAAFESSAVKPAPPDRRTTPLTLPQGMQITETGISLAILIELALGLEAL
jgi:hypothetical protein